jgi:thiamine pyrophosphate-dependent acetolactate synthase large subunit-like protein
MRLVDVLAKWLRDAGVSRFVCYPTSPVIEALAAAGARPIVCRQERVGVGIADGLARTSAGAETAIFAMQFGPGVENAFAGIATAYSDASPVLLLPLGHPRGRHGVRGYYDPRESVRSITKHYESINVPERLPEALRRAFVALRQGRPGPALVEVPWDLATAEVSEPSAPFSPLARLKTRGSAADTERVARRLVAAKRPVVLAGQGILYAGATEPLVALAELLDLPVATTLLGKSGFPEDHPLALGTGGVALPGPLVATLKEADFVLAVGTSLSRHYMTVKIPAGIPIAQITNAPDDLGREYAIEDGVLGDAALVLEDLLTCCRDLLGTSTPARRGIRETIASARSAWLAEWTPKLASDQKPMTPYRVIADCMQAIPPSEAIVTHDAGSPRDQVTPFYRAAAPRGYVSWGKSHALGAGLGLIMGAKLACPDKVCINFMGDAAFGMVGLDLETAVRAEIPIITVVLNNSTMAVETESMKVSHGLFKTRDLGGDYADIARALGAHAERIEEPRDIVAAFQRARKVSESGKPVLLEFITAAETAVSERAAFGLF